ncbi:MAG: signal peptidase I [Candidatus Binatia bacterium]
MYFAAPLGLFILFSVAVSLGGISGRKYLIMLAAVPCLFMVAGVVDAIISARKQSGTYELKPCNRLIVYVVVYVAMCPVALVVALLIRASVVEAIWVPSGAMLPTIQIGDRLFVSKLAYGMHLPFVDREVTRWSPLHRGDVVVFTSPVDRNIDLIKRVIAVAGDTVEIRKKRVYINGEGVADPHANFTDTRTPDAMPRDQFGPVTVPSGKFFVMGDNRDQSYDSRHWGFADERDVKGQAISIYWSRDRDRIGVTVQ